MFRLIEFTSVFPLNYTAYLNFFYETQEILKTSQVFQFKRAHSVLLDVI